MTENIPRDEHEHAKAWINFLHGSVHWEIIAKFKSIMSFRSLDMEGMVSTGATILRSNVLAVVSRSLREVL